MAFPPQRIVCLTAETTEIAFAVGCAEQVVGVSGYAVRPPQARRKPRVAAFSTASVPRILALQPDLVLGFSDLQADIARDLVRAGVNVLVTNQRTLEETYDAVRLVGAALGEPARAEALTASMRAEFEAIAETAARLPRRPRVFFEEWDDPLITGIGWVADIVRLCGGDDVFPELAEVPAAAGRIVSSAAVAERAPEVIIASWCGKKANLDRIRSRPGWSDIHAVRNGHVYEVKSADILQPGPSLIHGARQVARFVAAASGPLPVTPANRACTPRSA